MVYSNPTTAREKSRAVKGREIVDALADADEMHRQLEALGQHHQDAAARGAVELGHDQAGHAGDLAEDLDLAERVLPDRGVEHQQHGMRRGRLDLADHAHHLFQLAHQLGAVLQAAGGVDQHDVDALRLGGGDRVEGKARRVAAGRAAPSRWRRCARPRS